MRTPPRSTATSVFAILGSIAALAVTLPERAEAQPRADGLYAATFLEHADARSVAVQAGSGTTQARLRARLPVPDGQAVVSVANDNQRYRYTALFHRRSCPAGVVLLLDGAAAALAGAGTGNGQCRYDFELDRAQADRAAQAFGVSREDRAPHGERVEAAFRVGAATYAPGEAIEVRVDLRNPADAPAVQREGGCVRFTFVIVRDGGAPVALGPAVDGCPVGFAVLAAGATAQDSVDVGRWGNLQTPGHYRLECAYSTSFAPEGAAMYRSLGDSASRWDRTFLGIVEFDVK